MDMVIEGLLEGGATRGGTYDYAQGDKTVAVAGEQVSLTWAGCPDGSEATEKELQDWFDAELAAQVLATGVASTVNWRGWSLFDNGTRIGFRVSQVLRVGYIRAHPADLASYSAAADAIRRYPEAREAVNHYRAMTRLMGGGEDVALGEAYLAVATLVATVVGNERQRDWRAFGARLQAAGEPFDGDDLEQLYASAQWGRHRLKTLAEATLKRIGRRKMSWYDTCSRAAEVIEAYLRAKDDGTI